MSGWKNITNTIKKAPKSDVAVLLTTLVLTVVFDLVVAIGIGMVMASLLFMKRMADVTEAHTWLDIDDEDSDPDNITLKRIPEHTKVYEINGPMFFAASQKFGYMLNEEDTGVLVIRMRNVPAIDASGVAALADVVSQCRKQNVKVVFSHVNAQPFHAMKKAGLTEKVGAENFCDHIDTALLRAERITLSGDESASA